MEQTNNTNQTITTIVNEDTSHSEKNSNGKRPHLEKNSNGKRPRSEDKYNNIESCKRISNSITWG